MSLLLRSINILIYPYIFSYIKKEIYQIIQFKKDLILCKNGGDPNKKISDIDRNDIDNKTAKLYKNNNVVFYLSIFLLIILTYQALSLFFRINKSLHANRFTNLILLYIFMIVSFVMPIMLLIYHNSNNRYISEALDPIVNTGVLKTFSLWSYIFNIAMIANIGYSLLYNSTYFINIALRE